LDHDGAPWNTNPGEYEIKPFADYWRLSDGLIVEDGLSNYFVLLSV
jgi:hypothetical protein